MSLKKILRHRWLAGTGIAVLVIWPALFLAALGPFENLELKTLDARFELRGPVALRDSSIVIVAIDEAAFAGLPEKWPFPRRYFAKAIENLHTAGAKLIILDAEFTEPNLEEPGDDQMLADAIRKAGNVILAGKIAMEMGAHRMVHSYPMRPIKPLLATGAPWGIVNVVEDADGFIRRYLLFEDLGGTRYYPIGIEAVKFLDKVDEGQILADRRGSFLLGSRAIPKMDFNTMLINYRGPQRTFPTHSLASILDDTTFQLLGDEDTDIFEFHKAWGTFQDKIVFIGASVEELQDNRYTPFYQFEGKKQKMPGVEMHANALSTVLQGDFLRPVDHEVNLAIVAVLSLLTMVLVKRFKPWRALLLTLALVLLFATGIFATFIKFRLWLPMIAPLCAVGLSFGGNAVHQIVTEQREKWRYKKTFQQFMAQSVVEKMLSSGELPTFGGEKRRLTVLFSDVRDFTAYSERYPPEVVVTRLTEYLTAMVDVIFRYNGTLDKFVGDEIMAVYGAPYFFEDHAERACRTALEMVHELRRIQSRWSRDYKDYFQIGIGVNTGNVIVGNLGSVQLFDYTVIGDEVNLGARLEGTNKLYSTTVIISESTYNDVKSKAIVRELDRIRVKGRSAPVTIYELRGMDTIPQIEWDLLIGVYTKGLDHFRQRQWYQALREFRRVLRYFPSDGPSRVYTRRCLDFIEHPPPEEWDGVFEFGEK